MKSLWIREPITYTGEQLAPLHNYLEHGLLGNSMVAWLGPCDVSFDHMIDGEDLRDKSVIAADEMLHFVGEFFDFPLKAAVLLQRLMAEMAIRTLKELDVLHAFERDGDDIYFGKRKFNISIATCSPNSTLLHFAVNAKPGGAPVPIVSLQDLGVESETFAQIFLEKVVKEFTEIEEAAQKVRPV